MYSRTAGLGLADPKKRTVPLTLSTENPVDRGDFWEVLDHTPGAIDLSRSPLALLVGHDPRPLPIGVVDDLIPAHGRLRGVARFSSKPEADHVLTDVLDGIVRDVSIGYDYVGEGVNIGFKDRKPILRFKFKPVEVSAIGVGADARAGFFRSHSGETMNQDQEQNLSRRERALAEQQRVNALFDKLPQEDADDYRAHLDQLGAEHDLPFASVVRSVGGLERGYEAWRVDSIRSIGSMWADGQNAAEVKTLVRECALQKQTTVHAFREALTTMIAAHRGSPTVTGQLEADNAGYLEGARVNERYSTLKHFTGKNAEQRAHEAGMWFKAVAGDQRAHNYCVDRGLIQRSLGTGVFSAGGALIPDSMSNEIVNLVERYGVFRRFARSWPMENASLSIPVKTAGLSISALPEGSVTPTSDPAFAHINLAVKDFGGGCRVHRNLLNDSPIALGDFIIGEFGLALSEKEDGAGFLGDGTSAYTGIRGLTFLLEDGNHAGGVVDAVSPHNTFAEIDAVDLSNLMGRLPEYARAGAGWYLSSTARDMIFTRLMMVAGGNTKDTLQGGVGESFMGYPVRTSQVLPAGATTDYNDLVIVLFGNLAQAAAFGDRRIMEVDIDVSRFVEYREVYFQVTERFDIVNHHVGTATAAGPIVGLVGTT